MHGMRPFGILSPAQRTHLLSTYAPTAQTGLQTRQTTFLNPRSEPRPPKRRTWAVSTPAVERIARGWARWLGRLRRRLAQRTQQLGRARATRESAPRGRARRSSARPPGAAPIAPRSTADSDQIHIELRATTHAKLRHASAAPQRTPAAIVGTRALTIALN